MGANAHPLGYLSQPQPSGQFTLPLGQEDVQRRLTPWEGESDFPLCGQDTDACRDRNRAACRAPPQTHLSGSAVADWRTRPKPVDTKCVPRREQWCLGSFTHVRKRLRCLRLCLCLRPCRLTGSRCDGRLSPSQAPGGRFLSSSE